jgi:hypothetical protein
MSRPLTNQDYLLLTVVVITTLAGICALLVAIQKVLEEWRERRTDRLARLEKRAAPAGVRGRRPREAYRVSIVRH